MELIAVFGAGIIVVMLMLGAFAMGSDKKGG
jgi:hypothetical protein